MSRLVAITLVTLLAPIPFTRAAEPVDRGIDFFEKKVRPVFAEHCYACHSQKAKKLRGGLLLDSRAGILKGGDSGPAVVPGKPDRSLLVRALRQEQELHMPPKGKLPEATIADIARWIERGAVVPEDAGAAIVPRREAFRITEEDRRFWAFQPVADPAPPPVTDEAWAQSAIDRFILAHLEARGLKPSPPADRHALLRRVTFDLTGLPPTPAEIEAFVKDDSADAFEKVVDRLLASKEFGVRWARHWLDGVRYASNVDKSGLYRDWVVRAFNDDLRYDQFVRMQIAGDLIPAIETEPARIHACGASFDGVVASGMMALAVWEKVGRDLAVAEIVDSQIDVVGRQFLGLTLACARCHDHKFDPISTEDYYALGGIFFSSHISPGKLIADDRLSDDLIAIPLLTRPEADKNRKIDADIAGLEKQIASLQKQAGPAGQLQAVRNQLHEVSGQAVKASGDARKKLETQMQALRAEEKKLEDERSRRGWPENPPELADITRLRAQVVKLQQTKVAALAAIGIQERGVSGSNRERIGDVPIYIRGDYRKEGPLAPRRFPVILAGENQVPLGRRTAGSGRLELAEWIAAADHLLTARVMVNRIWLHLFGEGLVRTPDNFGRLGDRPSHPELLDHLARRFVAGGWSVKRLVREIVLSNAYRQTSFADPQLLRADPENRLVGRMSRKRLEYEALRDSLLFVGGPPARRTLFEPLDRSRIDPARAMFDGPDPLAIVPQRAATTTAPQALFLMNNPLVSQAALRLSQRLQHDSALKDDRARIAHAYLCLLGRLPSAQELSIGLEYLAKGAWTNYLQALLCTNEFVYLD